MQIETDDYVTVRQAFELLGVKAPNIHVGILRGSLAAIDPWVSFLVERASLETYRAHTQPDGMKVQGRPRKRMENGR